MSDRKGKDGQLLGPKKAAQWGEWRRARDNAIAKPRRLKTGEDPKGGRNSGGEAQGGGCS